MAKNLKDTFLNQANRIKIPDNQRPYIWQKQKIQKFIDEALEKQKNGEKHFSGITITHNTINDTPRKIIIYDGQQRITTIFLAIKYLYDHLKNIAAITEQQDILLEQIIAECFSSTNFKFENDIKYDPIFSIVKARNTPESIIKQLKQLKLSYQKNSERYKCTSSVLDTYNHAKKLIELGNEPLKLYKALTETIEIVNVEVEDEFQALTYFKRINTESERLEDKDILKNEFYVKKISKDLIRSKLNEIENLCYDRSLKDIYHYYLTIKKIPHKIDDYFLPLDRQLTSLIGREVSLGKSLDNSFVEAFNDVVRIAKIHETTRIFSPGSIVSDKAFFYLRLSHEVLKIHGIDPIHIMILDFFGKADASKSIKRTKLESCLKSINLGFFCSIILSSNTRKLKEIHNQFVDLTADSSTTISNIENRCILIFKEHTLPATANEKVNELLKNPQRYTKYILLCYEEFKFSSIPPIGTEFHIEHILPQNTNYKAKRSGKEIMVPLYPWNSWGKPTTLSPIGIWNDKYNDYCKKIGNLALFEAGFNTALKNKSIIEKYYSKKLVRSKLIKGKFKCETYMERKLFLEGKTPYKFVKSTSHDGLRHSTFKSTSKINEFFDLGNIDNKKSVAMLTTQMGCIWSPESIDSRTTEIIESFRSQVMKFF